MINLSLQQLLELIPGYVIEIAERLQQHGFEAYLVGGSLRDVLMGKHPNDYDIATNAMPDEIIDIFDHSIPTGAKFGTITVVGEDEDGEKFDVEVTTYRSEADYVSGRWPTKVEFTRTIDEDLARRDFTINAMALNLQEFDSLTEKSQDQRDREVATLLIDKFGGIDDLNNKVIKAVGDPVERFTEDGLRPVRGCRLASQLEFTIDQETFAAMQQTNHVTKQVSVERFRDEFLKLLYKSPQPSVGLRLMRDAGILEMFIPELLEGRGVTQPEFHVDDVFNHLMATVDEAEDRIKLAALFHDIAKPRTYSKDEKGVHFYGHDQLGAEMTKQILRRLKFPNAVVDYVSRLVRWHMFYYPSVDWRRLKNDNFDWKAATADEMLAHIEDNRKKHNEAGGWSDAAIRRLIQNVGGEEAIDDLLRLRLADANANPKSEFNPVEIEVLSARVSEVRQKEMALKVSDLDISGQDLMDELELEPGPKLGEILNHLLDQVIEDPMLNRKDKLLELTQAYVS